MPPGPELRLTAPGSRFTRERSELIHVDAVEGQVPQAAAGSDEGKGHPRLDACFRRCGTSDPGARLDHRASDRGRTDRHDPRRQARRENLDPYLPRQADHQETGGNPHGQGERGARGLGRRGQAGPDPLRDGGARRDAGARSAGACRRQDRVEDPLRYAAFPDGDGMKKKERETLAQQGFDDLAEKEKQLKEASWKLRLQQDTGQLENPSRLRVLRRDIARVKTYRRALELAEKG